MSAVPPVPPPQQYQPQYQQPAPKKFEQRDLVGAGDYWRLHHVGDYRGARGGFGAGA